MLRHVMLVLVVVTIGPAARAAQRVIVVPSDARGPGAKAVARAAEKAMVLQLSASPGVEASSAVGRRAKLLQRCVKDEECLRKVKGRLDADLLLHGSVHKSRRQVVVEIALISAKNGERVAQERATSPRPKNVPAQTAELAQRLVMAHVARVAKPVAPAPVASGPVRQAADNEEP